MAEIGETVTIKITDITEEGHGVGHMPDGMALFVPGAYPGDVAEAELEKVKKRYASARLLKIKESSENRLLDFCPYDDQCGGCPLGRLRESAQHELGKRHVTDVLERIAGIENPFVEEMTGFGGAADSEAAGKAGDGEAGEVEKTGEAEKNGETEKTESSPVRYRNKAVLKLGYSRGRNGAGKPLAGYFARKSHRLIDVKECRIQTPAADAAAEAVRTYMKEYEREIFDPKRGSCILKELTVRSSFSTGDVMAVLRIRGNRIPDPERLCELLDEAVYAAPNGGCRKIPDSDAAWSLESVWLRAENGRKTKWMHIAGKRTILDRIGDAKFEIGPDAFWQVNPEVTEKLYGKVYEYAGLSEGARVLDLYCGLGSIGLYLSKRMKDSIHLVGIESNEDAILGANRSAVINRVVHARYYQGKAEEVLTDLLEKFKKSEGRDAAKQNRASSESEEADPSAAEEAAPEIPVPDLTKTDCVILDPPRAGCEESLLDAVSGTVKPEKIVYVSCEPATFARDIRFLTTHGYRFEKAAPFDMFPHTGRIEVVSLLSRSEGPTRED